MKKLLTLLFCLLSISLAACNFSSEMSYPDYKVLPQYLYGDWKMDIQHSLEDRSLPLGKRESIVFPDNAYLSLTLNPNKTYRVVLFDGQSQKNYTHPENRWDIEQTKDAPPNLILYNPPGYMPGFEFSTSKEVWLVIIEWGEEKGNVAFWNGSYDAPDFFYRVE
jgi:hypothetical protein